MNDALKETFVLVVDIIVVHHSAPYKYFPIWDLHAAFCDWSVQLRQMLQ